jgi:hypothetical protein
MKCLTTSVLINKVLLAGYGTERFGGLT